MKAIRKAPEIPSARLLYREARVVADVARMTLPLLGASLMPAKPALGSRIILIPGFGADDRYTRPMRHFLTREGFPAEGWGLGRNMAGLDLPHSIDDLSPGWKIDRSRPYRGEASVPYLADRLAGILRGQH